MSVLLGDRKESKFEAITYSIELHDMLILLMQRGFGVKDVDSFVRKKYAYGEISEENFAKYRELMRSFKSKVNQCASLITSNVRAANTIYPRTMHEYEILSINWSIGTFQKRSSLAKSGWRSLSILETSFRKSLEFIIRIPLTIMSSMCVSRNFMEGIWTIGTS